MTEPEDADIKEKEVLLSAKVESLGLDTIKRKVCPPPSSPPDIEHVCTPLYYRFSFNVLLRKPTTVSGNCNVL